MNGTSKVRVTYSKYRMVPENIIWDDSDDDEDDEYLNQVKPVIFFAHNVVCILRENSCKTIIIVLPPGIQIFFLPP